MSATSSTPVIESKTARKRKAKSESVTPLPTNGSADSKVNGTVDEDNSTDSHYMKELAKQIRNLHKKLQGVQKTEAVIQEFPTTSLEDLVTQKKINADQKAQILKKPQLETQLKQFEEQQKQLKDFSQELEARHEKDKSTLLETHKSDVEKAKKEALQQATQDATAKVSDALQVICQFLHAAAYKRQQDDVDEQESKAYEGVLFHLYQGNSTALDAMTNLVEGKETLVKDPQGDEIDYTFAKLKVSAMSTSPVEGTEAHETTEAVPTPHDPIGTDPTIANASLTELEDTTAVLTSPEEATKDEDIVSAVPEQTLATADSAANAAAETAWNPEASALTDNTQSGEDWIQVPRDPGETETGSAVPAAQQSTSNWADEAGAAAEEIEITTQTENDGFSEVRRDRGGRGRGGMRGGGRGGDGRGRGRGRGEYRGRGRGNRGGQRGAPQAQSG